ncbi:MAG TPA: biotin/lipoyl-containing protein, partial [Steroidobacteraceae bacterium]|nr:biotin/lipoyl-containing protein [Steroidobacteraceae bacterium]
MAATTPVRVPDLGEFKAVDVIDVMVRVGDVVAVDSALATLETEKATMDVPSTAAGRVSAVLIKKGDKVSTGTPVVEL